MKRKIIQAMLFSALLIIIYYGIQVGYGYYLTLIHVPDIINSYQAVNYLQQEISFGSTNRKYTWLTELIGLFVIGILIFVIVEKVRGIVSENKKRKS
jgi:hypothetical protein